MPSFVNSATRALASSFPGRKSAIRSILANSVTIGHVRSNSVAFGRVALGGLSLAIALIALVAPAVAQSGLVSEITARRVGLTRAWFTQVAVSQLTDQISHVTLDTGTLFVQTSGGVLHALNAETGQTLWAKAVGERDRLSLAPGANAKYVATVNGSTLYLLDRSNGAIIWSRRLKGACGAGPVLTKTHVFAPMVTGMLEGYVLKDQGTQTPWIYQSFGRIFNQPVITQQSVSWTTDKGNLYVAKADPMTIRGRLQTRSPIESRPAYWTPYFYACSLDGYVYAVHEKSALTKWRFSVGEQIREPPIAVDGRVYVIPEFAGMLCLDAATGDDLWSSQGIAQFVAQSKKRIYAVDKNSQLAVLDAATGARLGVMPLEAPLVKLRNDRTDRIFFFNRTGLIECLHERDLAQPLAHEPPPSENYDEIGGGKPKAAAKKVDDAEAPAAGDAPAANAAADDMKPDDMKPDDAGDAMGDDKKKPDAMKEDDPFK